ncbi:RNA-binding domain-containing protein [Adlercreutzia faecimuris]|uniref:DNA binding domain-containing protein n=1 Tax=Adlercreutzia faecimuris TaxID=2897341 RepID=A0ABS9WIV4_9ACTN|nr:RNA-binding domain-containing protein [Adlercreutzia sp. JBNU-10]MCI2242809.1 putative DNA binding domain-containing protein [Adlercreutzia sp. JBNU-10]
MAEQELLRMIAHGEGPSMEFKRCGTSPGEDVFETICAFANRSGGTILLGIADDGTVTGVQAGQELAIQRNIASVARNPKLFSPPVSVETERHVIDDGTIIRIWVPLSPDVHSFKGTVFDRVADADIKIPPGSQTTALHLRKSGTFTEQRIYPYLRMDDLRLDVLAHARKLASTRTPGHPWSSLDDDQILRYAGLIGRDFSTGEEGLNLAAALLLGKDEVIAQILPAYKTDAIVRIHDADRYDDRIVVTTNLIDAQRQLMEFCAKNLPNPFFLEGDSRISLRDVICRELISNLLIHREYTNPFPAKLIIDENGIHTENASRAMFSGTISPLSFNPIPKNPLIARFFSQIAYADELGSGTRNLFKYSKHYLGADPILEEGDVFRAHVPKRAKDETAREPSRKAESAKGVPAIVMKLVQEGPVTVARVAEVAGVTRRTASSHLNRLAAEGVIVAHGETRNRRYELPPR